jgi:hypothetical protein
MTPNLSWLRGRSLEKVDADPHSWVFKFSGGGGLCAECPWRIIAHGGIALGSSDHQQKFGLPEPVDAARQALKLLARQQISEARIHPETCDLVVEFSAGARLELFNDSSGYEGWTLSSPEGRQVIAQGGGQLACI